MAAVVHPGQDLEGRGIGARDHVCLGDPGEALDGRTVEADAFFEGTLEFGRGDRHGFQGPDNVGEPQAHEPNVALFEGAEHELLLAIHIGERRHDPLIPCYIGCSRSWRVGHTGAGSAVRVGLGHLEIDEVPGHNVVDTGFPSSTTVCWFPSKLTSAPPS